MLTNHPNYYRYKLTAHKDMKQINYLNEEMNNLYNVFRLIDKKVAFR